MRQYLDLLDHVLTYGSPRADRTGVSTISAFAPPDMVFDLTNGFPAITTKRLAWKSVVWELLFFLRGETNNTWLTDRNVTIWNEWAKEDGDLGPIYGAQWRRWPAFDGSTIDQLQRVIDEIITHPQSRRLIVSAWNPAQISDMALPPCHMLFQFYVNNNTLNIKVTQRSADLFLGVPFNIASYALLTHILASITHLKPGRLIMSLGDAHIYTNHTEQVDILFRRDPFPLPYLSLPHIATLEQACSMNADDFRLVDYKSHPKIIAEIAV